MKVFSGSFLQESGKPGGIVKLCKFYNGYTCTYSKYISALRAQQLRRIAINNKLART